MRVKDGRTPHGVAWIENGTAYSDKIVYYGYVFASLFPCPGGAMPSHTYVCAWIWYSENVSLARFWAWVVWVGLRGMWMCDSVRSWKTAPQKKNTKRGGQLICLLIIIYNSAFVHLVGNCCCSLPSLLPLWPRPLCLYFSNGLGARCWCFVTFAAHTHTERLWDILMVVDAGGGWRLLFAFASPKMPVRWCCWPPTALSTASSLCAKVGNFDEQCVLRGWVVCGS